MTRDLTDAQLRVALLRHGLKECGYLGYVQMPCGLDCGVVGGSNRQRLAYFLRRLEEHPGPNSKECPGCISQLAAIKAYRERNAASASRT